jgi:hypothetical protein
VAGLVLPPPRPGVEVLLAVQGEPPVGAPRADVRVLTMPGTGVARSRNAVLDAARGEVLLFGDDDVTWHWHGISSVLDSFAADPSLSLALAQAVDEHGQLRKAYPRGSRRLTRLSSARAATYEMFVRPTALRRAGVRFDERFGAGTEAYLGDEYLLVHDALRAGLRGTSLPVVVASHPGVSSGLGYDTSRAAAARARVFTRAFGPWAPLVRLGFVVRHPRRWPSARLVWEFVAGGA